MDREMRWEGWGLPWDAFLVTDRQQIPQELSWRGPSERDPSWEMLVYKRKAQPSNFSVISAEMYYEGTLRVPALLYGIKKNWATGSKTGLNYFPFYFAYLCVASYHGQLEATHVLIFINSYRSSSLKLKNLLFSNSTDNFFRTLSFSHKLASD